MKKNRLLFLIVLAVITSMFLNACNYYAVPTVSEEELSMRVAGTRSALSTQRSVETMIVQLDQLRNQPTCPVCPTCPRHATPTPVETMVPTEEDPSTMIITPIGDRNDPNCLRLEFLGDVSIPPDTRLKPGEKFTKTWWVRNSGTCAWTTQFDLVNSGGELFGSTGKVDFTQDVAVGETVQLSIFDLAAPTRLGTYYSYWLIATPYGNRIGYGPNQQFGLGIKIIVASD